MIIFNCVLFIYYLELIITKIINLNLITLVDLLNARVTSSQAWLGGNDRDYEGSWGWMYAIGGSIVICYNFFTFSSETMNFSVLVFSFK